jgi:hypothetical protein
LTADSNLDIGFKAGRYSAKRYTIGFEADLAKELHDLAFGPHTLFS